MRQDRAHGPTRRALDPPDGDPAEADTHIMRVAGQASVSTTSRLVFELQAKGQDEGEHAFDKRLAVAQQLRVRRFVLKIDSDGPVFVFAGLAGGSSHGSSSKEMVELLMTHHEGIPGQLQGACRRRGFTTKCVGMWAFPIHDYSEHSGTFPGNTP